MNSIAITMHPLWIALLAILVSAPLFFLYLHLRQTRLGRRLRRKLLQRSWTPVFFEPYQLPEPPASSAHEEPRA